MYIATCSCKQVICTPNFSRYVRFVTLHQSQGHTLYVTEIGCPKPKVVRPKKDQDEKFAE